MAILLRCPICRDKFRWEFASEEKWPKNCPQCGEYIGIDTPDDVITLPAIRTASTKAHDALYREMEKGSEVRMQAAAEKAGCSVADMSALKMTNMLDGRKPGETYEPPVNNAVSAFMEQNNIGGFRGADGSGYSGAVQSGPLPNAGAQMRTALQHHHMQISGGAAVSDLPALETQQPGYRRRG